MYLTSESLPSYMLQRAVLQPQDVTRPGLMIIEMSRRNRNFKVLRSDHPGCFIKQASSSKLITTRTLHREAEFYRQAQNTPQLAAFRAMVPELRDYDPVRHTLTLELLPDSQSISQLIMGKDDFRPDIAADLGEKLAHLHSSCPLENLPEATKALLPGQVSSSLRLICDGRAQPLLQSRLTDGDCIEKLQTILKNWRYQHLIHNDLKLDNVQICNPLPDQSHDTGKEHHLRIVDWELVDIGDICWDLACVLTSYIQLWVLGCCETEDYPEIIEKVATEQPYLPPKVTSAIQAFNSSYILVAGRSAIETDHLDDALRARLAVITYEMSFEKEELPTGAIFFADMLTKYCRKSRRDKYPSIIDQITRSAA